MKECPHGALPFLGRLLISLIFILGGFGKIFDFQSAVAHLQSFGVGEAASVYILIGLLMELVGGILLLLGWYTRFALVVLMIFLLPTTLIFHSFWNYTGVEMQFQQASFMKNLSIYGGLLLVYSFGPGKWSVDACRPCRKVNK